MHPKNSDTLVLKYLEQTAWQNAKANLIILLNTWDDELYDGISEEIKKFISCIDKLMS
jgi:hypothetical protein